jgi:hypothetical protein
MGKEPPSPRAEFLTYSRTACSLILGPLFGELALTHCSRDQGAGLVVP